MKRVIILSLVLFVAVSSFAQMKVGVVGGINMANVSLDPEPDGLELKNAMKIGAGVVLGKKLADKVGLCVGLLYLGKGAEMEMTIPGFGSSESKLKATYLELPITIKYAMPMESMTPYLMVGPSIGYLLSAEMEDEDIKDDLKSLDIGVVAGLGIAIPMGDNTISVQASYAMGLVDINDDDTDDTSVKTKGIQILAGISMPLGE